MRPLAALLAALALALVGCGGDDGPAPFARDSGEEDGDPASRVIVEASDGAFNAAAVYRRAAPGVVTVRAILPRGSGAAGGQGSGFVLNTEGEIVTNAHVVTDGEARGTPDVTEARQVFVQFPDRNQVEAEIVGVDPFSDVALLRVDPEGLELEPLELGDIEDVEVGDPVAAIGSPFGERQSLSVGVVSATDRSIDSLTEFSIDGAIQTDASINPGNSGGPLLDAEGRVIGINQQIDTTSGGNQGVGFAVPVDLVERSVEQLREDGDPDYAYLGVQTTALWPQLAERLDLEVDAGALVADVIPGGPADEAGICCDTEPEDQIRFQGVPVTPGGDVILAINGQRIVGEAELSRIIARLDPGERVTLEVLRDGDRREVEVELGERPD
ncbi:MAG TPA: trypsin-like peptidase domain-containing protein [Solirubrobacterales bacterium]